MHVAWSVGPGVGGVEGLPVGASVGIVGCAVGDAHTFSTESQCCVMQSALSLHGSPFLDRKILPGV